MGIYSHRVLNYILETVVQKSFGRPGINKGVGLLFVQNPVKIMVEPITSIIIQCLSRLFDQLIGPVVIKSDIVRSATPYLGRMPYLIRITGKPASLSARAVPPVEMISTPRSWSWRTNSTRPFLSDTLINAR